MFNRVQTVGTVSEFMTGEYKINREIKKINKKAIKYGVKIGLVAVAGSMMLDISMPMAFASTCLEASAETAVPVFAGEDKIKETVLSAFDPIITLLKDLSYPIAGLMISGGSLMFMIGRKDKGIEMMQQAAIGYLLVHLSPILLKLLVGIGNGIA